MRSIVISVAIALALAGGCGKQSDVRVVSSPYSSGETHTEPVVFNGRPYTVAFAFKASDDAYDVTVAGKNGRPLGGQEGDRKIVEQIASSTVRHFACPDSKKGRIVPGSTKHVGDKWQMRARCAA